MGRPAKVLLLLMILAAVAVAQNPTATLVGTVQDATGAVIPGATVVARNTGTNLRWTGISGASGEFTIPNLPPASTA